MLLRSLIFWIKSGDLIYDQLTVTVHRKSFRSYRYGQIVDVAAV